MKVFVITVSSNHRGFPSLHLHEIYQSWESAKKAMNKHFKKVLQTIKHDYSDDEIDTTSEWNNIHAYLGKDGYIEVRINERELLP